MTSFSRVWGGQPILGQFLILQNEGVRQCDTIGNPTDKRVRFFKITLINELVRCDFLNQPKWSE